MNEDQLMEELYIEKLEAQEAEMEARGMMDAPDSFQIAGIDESELPENELTDADWDAWADEYELEEKAAYYGSVNPHSPSF